MALADFPALAIKPFDIQGPLNTVMGVAKTMSELRLQNLEAQRREIDVGNLQRYNKSLDPNDLKGSPDLYHTSQVGDTVNKQLTGEQIARRAHQIAAMPTDTPAQIESRTKAWRDSMDEFYKKGGIQHEFYIKNRDTPSNLVLNQAMRLGMSVPEMRATTGESPTAAAKGVAPYHPIVNPEPGKSQIQFPGARPGTPPQVGTPTGMIGGPDMPGAVTAQPQPMAPYQPPAVVPPAAPAPPNQPLTAKPVSTERIPPVSATPPAKPGPVGPQTKAQYEEEVPVVSVAPTIPEGPGILDKGMHPLAAQASTHAQERLVKDIEPTSAAAMKDIASLNAVDNILKSGKVPTNKLADVKLMVGGWLSTVMPVADASKLVGMDLPDAELLKKELVRRGLTFNRETLGAREAVMALQIGLQANPGMLTTVEGNRKIVGLFKAGAEYDIERGKAAAAYYKKQDPPHLVNFDTWFSNTHPPAQFMSKVLPYPMPTDPKDMQHGVTYEIPALTKDNQPILDPKTNQPKMTKGVWMDGRGLVVKD